MLRGLGGVTQGIMAMSTAAAGAKGREALAQGDLRAVAAAYDAHHARVRAFARRLLGDVDAAEEVVQDVFVALPKALGRYRGDAPIASFLLGITAKRCAKARRARVRRERAYRGLAREPDPTGPPDPEREAGRRRQAEALARALDALPMKQRTVFVLMAVEEHTSPEVADMLGVPEGTVRTRLMHARRKLRASLAKEGLR